MKFVLKNKYIFKILKSTCSFNNVFPLLKFKTLQTLIGFEIQYIYLNKVGKKAKLLKPCLLSVYYILCF